VLRYELFYNNSAGFEDFVEVFEQRLKEKNGVLAGRFELFLEAWHGGGSKWDKILKAAPEFGGLFAGFMSWADAKLMRMMTSVIAAPPSEVEQLVHRTLIDRLLLEGNALLLIAHSQGNLFANAAYAHAMKTSTPNSVQMVHIAPASERVNGQYTLADLDLVINGLRLAGGVPTVTSTIPPYASRPPGENGRKDLLGHGLVEIYLNPALSVSGRIDEHVRHALGVLLPGRKIAQAGTFTVTLTWDGAGDVDLHVYEPGGRKVYYGAREGGAGALDVDNTREIGPEHYYASCDPRRLKLGRYIVSVANYSRAQGRTATVQVASLDDGVLGTKSLVLGPPTGSYAMSTLFTIDVSKDENRGRLEVRLIE
jgi:hypothetical protein